MTAGLYIHFPFCEIRCGYCDFFTVTNRAARIPAYIAALKAEFQIYSRNPAATEVIYSTLYFGGGTPSLLQPAQLADIIKAARSAFHFHDETEITLETNPGTVDFDRLRELLAVGINRLSIGVQSFQEEELRFLDRDHTATDAVRCFDNARKAGFQNISIDLIFSLPGQDISAWHDNLESAVSLQPDHISAYNLTFEDGTPLTTQLRQGRFRTLPDETQREMHLLTIEQLAAGGLEQYEISNYAVSGFQSRHNKKYWDGSAYLGLGPSSHSYLAGRRFWNVRNLKGYLDSMNQGKLAVDGGETLNERQAAFERIYLGLRQRCGVNLHAFAQEFGISLLERHGDVLKKFFECDFNAEEIMADLTSGARHLKHELLEIRHGFLRLTTEGVILCDAICAEFA